MRQGRRVGAGNLRFGSYEHKAPPQASPERVRRDFEGRSAAVVTVMQLDGLLHRGCTGRRRRVLISTFDPLTIWFLWMAGFTLTI